MFWAIDKSEFQPPEWVISLAFIFGGILIFAAVLMWINGYLRVRGRRTMMDLLREFYGWAGVPHPIVSLIGAFILGGIILSVAWHILGKNYQRVITADAQSTQSSEPGNDRESDASRNDIQRTDTQLLIQFYSIGIIDNQPEEGQSIMGAALSIENKGKPTKLNDLVVHLQKGNVTHKLNIIDFEATLKSDNKKQVTLKSVDEKIVFDASDGIGRKRFLQVPMATNHREVAVLFCLLEANDLPLVANNTFTLIFSFTDDFGKNYIVRQRVPGQKDNIDPQHRKKLAGLKSIF